MNHSAAKRIMSVFLFILILGIGIQLCNLILAPKSDIIKNWKQFYKLDPQSIDILIVGSSHAYCSFDTNMIEKEKGKRTYMLAGNSQQSVQSYFNLKEVLKYQNPQIVILEAFLLSDSYDSFKSTRDWKKEHNLDGMRLGIPKIEAILAQNDISDWAYTFLKLPRYHKNWTDVGLMIDNYRFLTKDIDTFSAFRPSQSIMTEDIMREYAEQEYDPQENNFDDFYFHKIAELCRENDIKLYLVMAPMYNVYIQSINYPSWRRSLLKLAESERIPYIDCNFCYDEIGLTAQDFEDIFSTYQHLNRSGAEKMTSFLLDNFNEF